MGLNNALHRAEEWDGCSLKLLERMNEDEKKESGTKQSKYESTRQC